MRNLEVPDQYRKMYNRAMNGKSPRDAIRVHCIMCMGWQESLVDGCTAPTCPLYPYRNKEPIRELSEAQKESLKKAQTRRKALQTA